MKSRAKPLHRSWTTPAQRMLNKQRAWKAGKMVKLTVNNPDASATNMQKIRVDARTVWGSPHQKRHDK